MIRMKPCAKCRRLIYAGIVHTCLDASCFYHVPLRNPAPIDAHLAHPAQNAQGEAVEWQSRFNSIQGGWSPWRNISKAEYESMLSNTAVQMGSTQLRALYLHAERARVPAMVLHSPGGTSRVNDYRVGDAIYTAHHEYALGWNACRKFVLAADPAQPVEPAMVPAGWKIQVDGDRVHVTKPDGAFTEWHKRPATNGSGMYDLCRALAAPSQPEDAA